MSEPKFATAAQLCEPNPELAQQTEPGPVADHLAPQPAKRAVRTLPRVLEGATSTRSHGLNRLVIVHNLLSADECRALIAEAEELGLPPSGYDTRYRDCGRIEADKPELAARLWERLEPLLPDCNLELSEERGNLGVFGPEVAGTWVPIGLNPHFRLCRYEPGGHFGPHCDGFFRESDRVRSFLTAMVYLNDDFEGGATTFFSDDHPPLSRENDANGRVQGNMDFATEQVRCSAGEGIVFTQGTLLHQGDPLEGRLKYILRTDVMFERIKDGVKEEKREAARQLEIARDHEYKGNLEEAVKAYKLAFRLDPELERFA